MGVNIDPHSRMLFGSYLQKDVGLSQLPRIQCTTQVGWCGEAFVLPDTVIGPSASGVIFQSGERGYAEYERAGTLEGWQREVAAKAIGNPVLMGSISAAFMGPLLRKCHGESGGFHLVDDSSVGKSTCVRAAASVFGGPRHVRSWNSTARECLLPGQGERDGGSGRAV
jgi:putative DNA primase/helicase